ncbi:hypothetical protein [Mycoplana dimorpha]|uniref:YpeB-like protein with protease inhibitory function n=1 Tax=Mycoplana dimorpha TaxID=28320 RepID=A0A2T5AZ35_MYCDI|nr:hypothetical protein [Mycoplana dimorpha]PTM91971.1 hypothetical protein C7449_10817 [Mycoplana dimorpha]
MKAWSFASLTILAASVLTCLLAAAPDASAAGSYLTERGEAARAVDSIIAATGRSPRLLAVRLTDRNVTVELQGEHAPANVDEWRIGIVRRFFFDFETTVGPRASDTPGLVSDTTGGFFGRDEIALERVPEVVAHAIAYARLEDEAHVQSIEIARQVSILPEPAYGEIGWSIYVTSGRESATVRADAAGNIIGGDLSNTNRARRMDLLTNSDWPKREAMAALAAIFGEDRRLREFTVRPRALSVSADHPSIAGRKEDYTWTISGVTRSPLLSPLVHGASTAELFSLKDVDLNGLERIRRIARREWGNDEARLQAMTLRRERAVRGTELRWVVHFDDGAVDGKGDGNGTVEVTPDGTVRQVDLPDSRQPRRDRLAPQAIADTLRRVAAEFPQAARFAELGFDANETRILAEDPNRPGAMAEFVADDTHVARSAMRMPWDEDFRPERLFTMEAIETFTGSGRLAEFRARAYRRLGVDDHAMPIARYTFAIGQAMGPDGTYMVPSPDGRLTMEIRVESPDGKSAGRVTYASSGEEIDVVMP